MRNKTREELVDPVRIWTRLPRIKYEKMQQMADGLGLTLSQFMAICAWAGVQQVMPYLEPGVLRHVEWQNLYDENKERWQLYFEGIEEDFEEFQAAQRDSEDLPALLNDDEDEA